MLLPDTKIYLSQKKVKCALYESLETTVGTPQGDNLSPYPLVSFYHFTWNSLVLALPCESPLSMFTFFADHDAAIPGHNKCFLEKKDRRVHYEFFFSAQPDRGMVKRSRMEKMNRGSQK